MKQPNNFLLIIGAMKCGTTYLFNLLEQHPEIAGCLQKEPNFFSAHPNTSNPKWNFGMDYYRSLWSNWDKKMHKYAMEASTSYTKSPDYPSAPVRISEVADATFRFIYVIRNPLERIRSHIQFMTVFERRRFSAKRGIYQNGRLSQRILDITSYAKQLDGYYRYFPPEAIKIILFEDLKATPEETSDKIFKFLNLPPCKVDVHLGSQETNDSKAISFKPWVYSLRNSININTSFRKYIPLWLKNYFADDSLQNFQLTDNKKNDAIEHLRHDLFKLRDEYKVDISKWNLSGV